MIPPPDRPASQDTLHGEASLAVLAPVILEMPDVPRSEPAKRQRRGRHFGRRPVADRRSARLDMRCTPVVQAKAEAARRPGASRLRGMSHR
jgi:hypothetical protein